MNSDKWREISEIFHLASELEGAERDAFLERRCGGDAEMRRELEGLLKAGASADSFIDSPVSSRNTARIPKLTEGVRLASFEIETMLGAGGMGEVYLARDTRLNRRVAVKVLSSDTDPDANRRFLREAQSAAALEHPNICATHEIGEDSGFSFIVMQYVEGETLAAKIRARKLSTRDALSFAIQTADALTEAHSRRIVHRDIKPANIIVSDSGQAKVLDFGLAKRIGPGADGESSFQTLANQSGLIMGTVSYMSPEQIRGQEVDARSDLWSLGVVLFEMLFGRTPFGGENAVERLAAILYEEPSIPDDAPPELSRILLKALRKKPDERYQSAEEVGAELRRLQSDLEFAEQLQIHATSGSGDAGLNETLARLIAEQPAVTTQEAVGARGSTGRKFAVVGLFAVIAVLVGVGAYVGYSAYRQAQANADLSKVFSLADAERNFEAYDIAIRVAQVLPENKPLAEIMPRITDSLSVTTNPDGARVYLKRFQPTPDGVFPERQFVGTTPLADVRIARGSYVLEIEKDGFAPFQRTISGTLPRIGDSFIEKPPLKIEATLVPAAKLPARMVFVPGGEYSLVNWSRSTESKVALADYYIDKYEVTNAEYKEFITAGGYVRAELWKVPFVRDGKEMAAGDALGLFKDRTGLPGPRSWTNQNYPEGKADFPVTDITWYEAAAYAEFRGKSLPTIFQWEKAAREGVNDPRYNAMPWGVIRQGETTDFRANFSGTSTAAVDSNPFGMSPYGAFNMAGNVSEWNLNRSSEGFVTSGGAWNDLAYAFGDHGEYPGLYSENRIGFRCVLNTETARDQGAERIPPPATPEYRPSTDAEFRTALTHYEYDAKPLGAKIVETSETENWTREKITFAGEGGEQATAYLYLPKNHPRPLQVIHYVPPGDVTRGLRSLPDSIEMFAAPLIKSGRAVFGVVLRGYVGRPFPVGYAPVENSTVEFRKQMVNWITDLRRGVDYLETRDDLIHDRIAFLGISNGANLGLVLTAIETRYKALVFESAGLEKSFTTRSAETSPIGFASHIKPPKLVINGRYDETFPFATDAKPLFKLLRDPKKIVLYDGGHIPTAEFFVPTVSSWLDETIGAVPR